MAVCADPNDILVRAVPNLPGVASFIDEEWTTFVAEFNVCSRAVSKHSLLATAMPLLKYLHVRVFRVCVCSVVLLGSRCVVHCT